MFTSFSFVCFFWILFFLWLFTGIITMCFLFLSMFLREFICHLPFSTVFFCWFFFWCTYWCFFYGVFLLLVFSGIFCHLFWCFFVGFILPFLFILNLSSSYCFCRFYLYFTVYVLFNGFSMVLVGVYFMCSVILSLLLLFLNVVEKGLCWCSCFFITLVAVYSSYWCCCFFSVANSASVSTFDYVSTVYVVADFPLFSVFGSIYVFIWDLFLCVFCFHLFLIQLCSLLPLYFDRHRISTFHTFVCFCLSYFAMFSGLSPITAFVGFSFWFEVSYFCSCFCFTVFGYLDVVLCYFFWCFHVSKDCIFIFVFTNFYIIL